MNENLSVLNVIMWHAAECECNRHRIDHSNEKDQKWINVVKCFENKVRINLATWGQIAMIAITKTKQHCCNHAIVLTDDRSNKLRLASVHFSFFFIHCLPQFPLYRFITFYLAAIFKWINDYKCWIRQSVNTSSTIHPCIMGIEISFIRHFGLKWCAAGIALTNTKNRKKKKTYQHKTQPETPKRIKVHI